jgi:hypothetical protein
MTVAFRTQENTEVYQRVFLFVKKFTAQVHCLPSVESVS